MCVNGLSLFVATCGLGVNLLLWVLQPQCSIAGCLPATIITLIVGTDRTCAHLGRGGCWLAG